MAEGTYGTSRPRATNVCRECRRRKLRCDQRRPTCSRCADMPGLSCVYDEGRRFQFVPQEGPPGLRRSEPSSSTAALSGSVDMPIPIAAHRLQDVEARIETLSDMVQSLRSARTSDVEVSASASDLEDTTQAQAQATKRTRASSPDASELEGGIGLLHVQSGGKTRYVSRSFWATICEEAAEIEGLLRDQNRPLLPADLDEQPWRRPALTGALLAVPPLTSTSMREKVERKATFLATDLPNRAACDCLLQAYRWYFHPVVRLLHLPSFEKEYERFWENRSRASAQQLTHSTPLILAAMYAGAIVCPVALWQEHYNPDGREDIISRFYWMASQALRICNFPRVPTVEALSAYMIVQGLGMREEEPLTTASFIGVIVRVAQMLGLNREPSIFKTSISPIAAEIRRRVWWHVFYLDVNVAIASGLPPLIDRDCWDVRELSELAEEQIGTIAGVRYDEQVLTGQLMPANAKEAGALVSPIGIFIKGKMHAAIFARGLLNRVFGTKALTLYDLKATQAELEKLEADMRARVRRIPMITEEPSYESNNECNTWTKMLLWSMGDQYWWFMHTPLLNRALSQAWSDLHPRILHHCRAYLQKFVCLAACSIFQRYQWAWPGNHQPLHAIMILLKEVERDPTSADAPASRAVIDQTMALCGPDGGVIGMQDDEIMSRPLQEGGQDAWDLITRLRSRAWIKAGLDPDRLLTRAEVARMAEAKMQTFFATYESEQPASWPELELQPFDTPSIAAQPSSPGGLLPNLNWQDWDAIIGAVE